MGGVEGGTSKAQVPDEHQAAALKGEKLLQQAAYTPRALQMSAAVRNGDGFQSKQLDVATDLPSRLPHAV